MDALEDSGPDLFNSTLELGIRAVALLEKLRPRSVSLSDLVVLDHLVVHTGDIHGPPSLHPAVPERKGELLVHRALLQRALDLMQRCHLVSETATEAGLFYGASDEAAAYLDVLQSDYSQCLIERASWLATEFKSRGREEFSALVREQVGDWTSAFLKPRAPGTLL